MKDSLMNTSGQRGFAESWLTDINRKLKVGGHKVKLPQKEGSFLLFLSFSPANSSAVGHIYCHETALGS